MPIGGFKNLQGRQGEPHKPHIKLIRYEKSELGRYPKGHTCFNRIDLPEYPSESEMRVCLEAVTNISTGDLGFGLE